MLAGLSTSSDPIATFAIPILQTLLGMRQAEESKKKLEGIQTPQFGQRAQALATSPETRRFGLKVPEGMGQFAGGPAPELTRGNNLADLRDMDPNALVAQELHDRLARAQVTQARNEELRAILGDLITTNRGDTANMRGTLGTMRETLGQGRADILAERRALSEAGQQSSQAAAMSIEGTLGLLNSFHRQVDQMLNEVKAMGTEAINEVRDLTAARQLQATQAVDLQTRAQEEQVRAEMTAMGAPPNQIMDAMARVRANGGQMLDDMLAKNMQASNELMVSTRLNVLGAVTNAYSTAVSGAGAMGAAAMGEIGRAYDTLSARKSELAQANANLGAAGRNWESAMLNNEANFTTMIQKAELEGRTTEVSLLNMIQDPIILMGDVVNAGFNAWMELDQLDYEMQMERFGLEESIDARAYGVVRNALQQAQYNMGTTENAFSSGEHTAKGAVGGAASGAAAGTAVAPGWGTIIGGIGGAIAGGVSAKQEADDAKR